MPRNARETIPVWVMGDRAAASFPALHEKINADVCIVGGGIAGLTSAYLLQKAGLNCVVVEARDIAAGETGRTTAHLTAVLDERYFRLEELHGKENARLAAESHRAAISHMEALAAAEGIDCAFTRLDAYLVASGAASGKELKQEQEALHRVGLTDAAYIPDITAFSEEAAWEFPHLPALHISSTVGSEAWNSRDLKSRPH